MFVSKFLVSKPVGCSYSS